MPEPKGIVNLNLGLFGGENHVNFAPQVIFKDGKIVVDHSNFNVEPTRRLTIVENQKPYKLTSMSFRTKNHTKVDT
jgi:hypothetical protein